MFAEYLQAAMRRAEFEILEDDGTYYGHLPDLPGAWANADTLDECRRELAEVAEEWILLGIAEHHPLPIIDGVQLVVPANVG